MSAAPEIMDLVRRGLQETDGALATRCLTGALALAPAEPMAWIALGERLARQADPRQAVVCHRRAASLVPTDFDVLIRLALAERALGRRWPAIRLCERVVALAPERREGHYWLATLLFELSRADDAIHSLRRSVLIAPAFLEGQLNLGIQLRAAGRFEEAEAAFGQAAGVAGPHAGVVAVQRGDFEVARGRLDRAGAILAPFAANPAAAAALERCREHGIVAGAAARPDLADGLVVSGAIRDTSGYAHAARRFIGAMHAAGRRLWTLDRKGAAPAIDEAGLLPPGLDQPLRARVQLAIALPPMVERLPGLRTVNFTMFEAARIPRHWLAHSLRHDLVVVPTRSSRDAWMAAGMPGDRVALCPLGVDARPAAAPLALVDNRGRALAGHKTRFLNISDLTLRKNLAGLLRVWLRATAAGDDAALVLKVGKGHDNDRDAFLSVLRHVERTCGKAAGDAAPMFLLTGKFGEEGIAQLFAAATHYVSLSFGEGWDLPMTQAGAAGLHLVAPAHSAYLDYLDDGTATLVPVRRVPALDMDGSPAIGFDGLEWWNPDEEAAIEAVRAAIAGRLAPKSARRGLIERFTWGESTARLLSILDGL